MSDTVVIEVSGAQRGSKRLHKLNSIKIWDDLSGFDSPFNERVQHKNQDAAFQKAMNAAIKLGLENPLLSASKPGLRVGLPVYLCSEE